MELGAVMAVCGRACPGHCGDPQSPMPSDGLGAVTLGTSPLSPEACGGASLPSGANLFLHLELEESLRSTPSGKASAPSPSG